MFFQKNDQKEYKIQINLTVFFGCNVSCKNNQGQGENEGTAYTTTIQGNNKSTNQCHNGWNIVGGGKAIMFFKYYGIQKI